MAWAATDAAAEAQGTVNVTVPTAVSFSVTDVTVNTGGAPNPVRLSFSNGLLVVGSSLRVSLKADLGTFTPPSGSGILASNVSWTSVGANGGTGSNGTLDSSSYRQVFDSNIASAFNLPLTGYVDLSFSLAAPGGGIRAGAHQLTIRWKLESF